MQHRKRKKSTDPLDESEDHQSLEEHFRKSLRETDGFLLLSGVQINADNIDTCATLLKFAHDTALDRNLALGFLGNMFDTISRVPSLPVRILDRLIQLMADWKVPTIMIYGRLDIASNGPFKDGSESSNPEIDHGLRMFGTLNPRNIWIVHEPQIIDLGIGKGGKQLWIPWRENQEDIGRLIEIHRPDAVFHHGEDRESLQNGHAKIYSGYSRKANTKGAFTFVGSPYQLTFEESEHANSMPVVRFGRDWTVSDRVEFGRLAPRHYILRDDTEARRLIEGNILRAGDKVRIFGDGKISPYLGHFQTMGVRVFTVNQAGSRPSVSPSPPMSMSFGNIWTEYGKSIRYDTHSPEYKLVEARMQRTLEGKSANHLKFTELKLCGFGPYERETVLDLDPGGTTLLCSGKDGVSNGAGKSMLVCGALLWVLTGDIDDRRSVFFFSHNSNLKTGSQHYIHTSSNRADVWLTGKNTGGEFVIHRSIGMSGPEQLTLSWNGKATKGPKKELEEKIARHVLGLPHYHLHISRQWILQHVIWMQNSRNTWLSAVNGEEYNKFLSTIIDLKQIDSIHAELKLAHQNLKREDSANSTAIQKETARQQELIRESELRKEERKRWLPENPAGFLAADPSVSDEPSLRERLELYESEIRCRELYIGNANMYRDRMGPLLFPIPSIGEPAPEDSTIEDSAVEDSTIEDSTIEDSVDFDLEDPATVFLPWNHRYEEILKTEALLDHETRETASTPEILQLKRIVETNGGGETELRISPDDATDGGVDNNDDDDDDDDATDEEESANRIAALAARLDILQAAADNHRRMIANSACFTCRRPFDHSIDLLPGFEIELRNFIREKENVEQECRTVQRGVRRRRLRKKARAQLELSRRLEEAAARTRVRKENLDSQKRRFAQSLALLIDRLQAENRRRRTLCVDIRSRLEICRLQSCARETEHILQNNLKEIRAIETRLLPLLSRKEQLAQQLAIYDTVLVHSGWFTKKTNGFHVFLANYCTSQLVEKANRWLRVLFPTASNSEIRILPTKENDRKPNFHVSLHGSGGIPSGGQIRLFEIAAFLGMKEMFPQTLDLLIFDEVTHPMDDESKRIFQATIDLWCLEKKGSCFFVSHDPLQRAESHLFNQVLVLEKFRLSSRKAGNRPRTPL